MMRQICKNTSELLKKFVVIRRIKFENSKIRRIDFVVFRHMTTYDENQEP